MRIVILMLILITVCSNMVFGDKVIPITNELTLDFRSPTSFIMYLPGGLEKHYTWNENQTYTDQNVQFTYNYVLDENQWCSDNSQLDEYKNISLGLTKMLNICGNVINAWNASDKVKQQKLEVEKDRNMYEMESEAYRDKWQDCKNSSDGYKADMQEYMDKWETCSSSLTACERARGEYQTCDKELTAALGSKNTFAFFGAVAGLVIGYFMWGRKQKSGPSEQAEAGFITDGTQEIPQRDYKQPTFRDGPRN